MKEGEPEVRNGVYKGAKVLGFSVVLGTQAGLRHGRW